MALATSSREPISIFENRSKQTKAAASARQAGDRPAATMRHAHRRTRQVVTSGPSGSVPVVHRQQYNGTGQKGADSDKSGEICSLSTNTSSCCSNSLHGQQLLAMANCGSEPLERSSTLLGVHSDNKPPPEVPAMSRSWPSGANRCLEARDQREESKMLLRASAEQEIESTLANTLATERVAECEPSVGNNNERTIRAARCSLIIPYEKTARRKHTRARTRTGTWTKLEDLNEVEANPQQKQQQQRQQQHQEDQETGENLDFRLLIGGGGLERKRKQQQPRRSVRTRPQCKNKSLIATTRTTITFPPALLFIVILNVAQFSYFAQSNEAAAANNNNTNTGHTYRGEGEHHLKKTGPSNGPYTSHLSPTSVSLHLEHNWIRPEVIAVGPAQELVNNSDNNNNNNASKPNNSGAVQLVCDQPEQLEQSVNASQSNTVESGTGAGSPLVIGLSAGADKEQSESIQSEQEPLASAGDKEENELASDGELDGEDRDENVDDVDVNVDNENEVDGGNEDGNSDDDDDYNDYGMYVIFHSASDSNSSSAASNSTTNGTDSNKAAGAERGASDDEPSLQRVFFAAKSSAHKPSGQVLTPTQRHANHLVRQELLAASGPVQSTDTGQSTVTTAGQKSVPQNMLNTLNALNSHPSSSSLASSSADPLENTLTNTISCVHNEATTDHHHHHHPHHPDKLVDAKPQSASLVNHRPSSQASTIATATATTSVATTTAPSSDDNSIQTTMITTTTTMRDLKNSPNSALRPIHEWDHPSSSDDEPLEKGRQQQQLAANRTLDASGLQRSLPPLSAAKAVAAAAGREAIQLHGSTMELRPESRPFPSLTSNRDSINDNNNYNHYQHWQQQQQQQQEEQAQQQSWRRRRHNKHPDGLSMVADSGGVLVSTSGAESIVNNKSDSSKAASASATTTVTRQVDFIAPQRVTALMSNPTTTTTMTMTRADIHQGQEEADMRRHRGGALDDKQAPEHETPFSLTADPLRSQAYMQVGRERPKLSTLAPISPLTRGHLIDGQDLTGGGGARSASEAGQRKVRQEAQVDHELASGSEQLGEARTEAPGPVPVPMPMSMPMLPLPPPLSDEDVKWLKRMNKNAITSAPNTTLFAASGGSQSAQMSLEDSATLSPSPSPSSSAPSFWSWFSDDAVKNDESSGKEQQQRVHQTHLRNNRRPWFSSSTDTSSSASSRTRAKSSGADTLSSTATLAASVSSSNQNEFQDIGPADSNHVIPSEQRHPDRRHNTYKSLLATEWTDAASASPLGASTRTSQASDYDGGTPTSISHQLSIDEANRHQPRRQTSVQDDGGPLSRPAGLLSWLKSVLGSSTTLLTKEVPSVYDDDETLVRQNETDTSSGHGATRLDVVPEDSKFSINAPDASNVRFQTRLNKQASSPSFQDDANNANASAKTKKNYTISSNGFDANNNNNPAPLDLQASNATAMPVPHNVNYWRLIWFVLPIGATFGNLLVILAVYRERSLQSVTNYFIVSLAFADLFVGLVVMPFAVYVLVNEVWELGDTLCDIFVAVDVTSSTASILNLVAISIDRYLAIAHPIAYSASTSSTRAILTICMVWLISCCVGAPIILDLNTTPERISTLCIFYNSTFIFWSSLTSFYVPCIIMIGLYWRIFLAIRSRTKKVMIHHNQQRSKKCKKGATQSHQSAAKLATEGMAAVAAASFNLQQAANPIRQSVESGDAQRAASGLAPEPERQESTPTSGLEQQANNMAAQMKVIKDSDYQELGAGLDGQSAQGANPSNSDKATATAAAAAGDDSGQARSAQVKVPQRRNSRLKRRMQSFEANLVVKAEPLASGKQQQQIEAAGQSKPDSGDRPTNPVTGDAQCGTNDATTSLDNDNSIIKDRSAIKDGRQLDSESGPLQSCADSLPPSLVEQSKEANGPDYEDEESTSMATGAGAASSGGDKTNCVHLTRLAHEEQAMRNCHQSNTDHDAANPGQAQQPLVTAVKTIAVSSQEAPASVAQASQLDSANCNGNAPAAPPERLDLEKGQGIVGGDFSSSDDDDDGDNEHHCGGGDDVAEEPSIVVICDCAHNGQHPMQQFTDSISIHSDDNNLDHRHHHHHHHHSRSRSHRPNDVYGSGGDDEQDDDDSSSRSSLSSGHCHDHDLGHDNGDRVSIQRSSRQQVACCHRQSVDSCIVCDESCIMRYAAGGQKQLGQQDQDHEHELDERKHCSNNGKAQRQKLSAMLASGGHDRDCKLMAPTPLGRSDNDRKRSSSTVCCDSYATSTTRCQGHSWANSDSFECTNGTGSKCTTQGFCSCQSTRENSRAHNSGSNNNIPVQLAHDGQANRTVDVDCNATNNADNVVVEAHKQQREPASVGMIESAKQTIKKRSIRLTNMLRGKQKPGASGNTCTSTNLGNQQNDDSQPAQNCRKTDEGDNAHHSGGYCSIALPSPPPVSPRTNGGSGATEGVAPADEPACASDSKGTRGKQQQSIGGNDDSNTQRPCLSTDQCQEYPNGAVGEQKKGAGLEGLTGDEPMKSGRPHDDDPALSASVAPVPPTAHSTLGPSVHEVTTTMTSSTNGYSRSTPTTTDKSVVTTSESTKTANVVPSQQAIVKGGGSVRYEGMVASTSSKVTNQKIPVVSSQTHLVASVFNLMSRQRRHKHDSLTTPEYRHQSLWISGKQFNKNQALSSNPVRSESARPAYGDQKMHQQLQNHHHHRPGGGGSRRRREKNAARRERKATKTLAIVLGIFLICWTPFFTCNIIDGICIQFDMDCRPGMMVYLVTSWLGYINSCVNPIIYTIFNMEFRRAFKKILTTRPNCSCCYPCIG